MRSQKSEKQSKPECAAFRTVGDAGPYRIYIPSLMHIVRNILCLTSKNIIHIERINMSIIEYNFRILFFHILLILGASWILIEGVKSAKHKALKTVLFVVTVIVLLALIFSLFASLSYRDGVSDYGRVIDISHTSSFAGGILDSYSVRIEKSDGTATWYHVSIFSSSSFKDSVESLEIGDNVELYANNFLDVLYRYKKIDID